MSSAIDSFLALSAARLAPRTVDAYRRDLRDLEAWLGGAPDDATPDQLAAYVAQLRADGLAATTIARRVAALRSFYRHQVLLGVRPDNPAAELELPRRRRALPKTMSPGEVERLIDAAAGTTPRALRDRALVELLYGAGLRVSEAVGLDRASIDLERRLVRTIGKGSKERVVPIGREAVDALRRYDSRGRPYLDKRHRPELFLNAQGGPLTRAGAFFILRRLADVGRARAGTRAPAPPAPLVRHPPAGRRRRSPLGSGNARTRGSGNDRALYPRIRSPPSRVVFPSAPPRSHKEKGLTNSLRERGTRMMFAPHVATLAVATLAIGWLMTMAGLQKSALELKKRRRVCPSCGRRIDTRTCASCV